MDGRQIWEGVNNQMARNLGIYLDDEVTEALDHAVQETAKRSHGKWSRSRYLNTLLARTLQVERKVDLYLPPVKKPASK